MSPTDGRVLSPEAQEALRLRAVRAVLAGGSQSDVARVMGVSRQHLNRWMRLRREGGWKALQSQKRGPKTGASARLAGWQAATIVNLIRDRTPDQLRLPFVLWTRQAVGGLIAERFGITLSLSSVGRYLHRWGFTPQKPLKRARERDPAAVARWLKKEYPKIRRTARKEQAEIHWGDEMGLRSDHQTGTSYAPKGRTPVIAGTGRRFGCNMISALSNRGRLRFMVFRKRFTSEVFIEFMERLIRNAPRKTFLIVDNLAAHKSRAVETWLAVRQERIRVFYLPPYSPELNPDEMLNHDVKANALGRRRPSDAHDMEADLRGYLRGTQRRPDIVRNYFRAPSVRYAAH